MVTKPIYNFDSGASLGIEEVPNNSIVHVQDIDSDGSNNILQLVKTGDDGTLGGKTITEFVNNYATLYTLMGGSGVAGVTSVLQATVDILNGDDSNGRFGDPAKAFATIDGVLSNITGNNTVEIFIIGTADWGGKQYQLIGKNLIFYSYDTGAAPGVDTSKIVLTNGFSAYLAAASNIRFYIKMDLEYGAGATAGRAFYVGDNSSVQFYNHRVHTFTTSLAVADPYVTNGTTGLLNVPNAGAITGTLLSMGGAGSTFTFTGLDIDDAVLGTPMPLVAISSTITTSAKYVGVTYNGIASTPQDFVDRTAGIKRFADGAPSNLMFPDDLSGTTGGLIAGVDFLVATDGESVFTISGVRIDSALDINLYVNGMRKPNGSGAGLLPKGIPAVFTLLYTAPDTVITFTSGNERDANDTIYIELIK